MLFGQPADAKCSEIGGCGRGWTELAKETPGPAMTLFFAEVLFRGRSEGVLFDQRWRSTSTLEIVETEYGTIVVSIIFLLHAE